VSEKLVVIGGDAAGMSAASQARRRRGPDDLEIVAFERGHYTSYSACGIPYYLGGVVDEFDSLIVREPEEFRRRQSIDARIRHEVIEIDLDARKVRVRNVDDGAESIEGFDILHIATGAEPIRPAWPGWDSEGIFGVQVLDHARAVEGYLRVWKPRRAVIVGGGYIGLEMAEALCARDISVTLVENAPEPMRTIDPDMGSSIREAMTKIGIDVRTGVTAEGFESRDGRVSAVATDQGEVPADIVVLGLGVQPNAQLAADAGLHIGESGGITVDRRMRTSVDGVYSAGDCAEKFHLISRKGVAIALGTHANKEGRVAGVNIGGGYETFPGVLGTAAVKVCDLEVARTGLNESEAVAAGFEFFTSLAESTTRAGYYPDAKLIKLKLVVETGSGRLLGAQIVGEENAAKRIDAFAAMLWNEMTVDEIMHVDLAYAPPFAPTWDPILIAARKAWERLEKSRGDS
jgi:NADPH-dependent 2,4-dienoyl-CoA reductase/sulfur reductase-like enzyme